MNNFTGRVSLIAALCIGVVALIMSLRSKEPGPSAATDDNAQNEVMETVSSEISMLRDDILALRTEIASLSRSPSQTIPTSTVSASYAPLAPAAENDLQVQVNALKGTVDEIRRGLVNNGTLPPGSNEVFNARAAIMNRESPIQDKLAALQMLRRADARTDDVVREMVLAYYSTDNENSRADIFRQLDGVTTPELKVPLLEAVSQSANSRVRAEAADTLANYLPDPDVKGWLEHLAANDPTPRVRREAQRSLRRLQN